jgi:hypothetical protein
MSGITLYIAHDMRQRLAVVNVVMKIRVVPTYNGGPSLFSERLLACLQGL